MIYATGADANRAFDLFNKAAGLPRDGERLDGTPVPGSQTWTSIEPIEVDEQTRERRIRLDRLAEPLLIQTRDGVASRLSLAEQTELDTIATIAGWSDPRDAVVTD